MDQHLQFRANAMKQAMSPLGNRRPRLPVNTPPAPRSHCDAQGQLSSGRQLEPAEVAPSTGRRNSRRAESQTPAVRAQVKQLQFWLKVFSRFCQDERDHGQD
jgi:hypothetical protein